MIACRIGVLIAAVGCLLSQPGSAQAQSRPAGSHRTWLEAGVGAARQSNRCRTCIGSATTGGAALTLAVGRTFTHGAGVALLGRVYQEVGFDATGGSRYVAALGQYSPQRMTALTISAGAGWGDHHGGEPPYDNDGQGPVLAAGAAIRLPARSNFALGVTADVVQSVGGSPDPRLRLLTIGLALSVATTRIDTRAGDR